MRKQRVGAGYFAAIALGSAPMGVLAGKMMDGWMARIFSAVFFAAAWLVPTHRPFQGIVGAWLGPMARGPMGPGPMGPRSGGPGGAMGPGPPTAQAKSPVGHSH